MESNFMVVCSACGTRVLPMSDGRCPNCQAGIPLDSKASTNIDSTSSIEGAHKSTSLIEVLASAFTLIRLLLLTLAWGIGFLIIWAISQDFGIVCTCATIAAAGMMFLLVETRGSVVLVGLLTGIVVGVVTHAVTTTQYFGLGAGGCGALAGINLALACVYGKKRADLHQAAKERNYGYLTTGITTRGAIVEPIDFAPLFPAHPMGGIGIAPPLTVVRFRLIGQTDSIHITPEECARIDAKEYPDLMLKFERLFLGASLQKPPTKDCEDYLKYEGCKRIADTLNIPLVLQAGKKGIVWEGILNDSEPDPKDPEIYIRKGLYEGRRDFRISGSVIG